jgi:GNAT superfamily N-acetyltransferase
MDQSPPGVVDAKVLADCHANYIEAFRLVARAQSQGVIEEERGVTRIASGIPTPVQNSVFLTEVPRDPAAEVSKAVRFMESAKVARWRIVALNHVAPALGSLPEIAGLIERHEVPGMILSPIPPRPPPPPPGLRIRRATTPALWEQMIRTGVEGLSGRVLESASSRFPFELSATIRGYLGYVGKVPVATSWEVTYRGVSGLFFVATLPQYRGRGIGAAMTWRAAVDGGKDGCRISSLQASEMGFPVYSKMGFRRITTYTEWQTP